MGLLSNQMRAGAAGAAGGGGAFYDYQIASSIRNSAAQDGTLKFTAGTPTSRKTFTMSYWVKRYDDSDSSSDNVVFTSGAGGGSYLFWSFASNDFQLEGTGGGWTGYQKSDAKYRDPSAWYHHVLTFDSTQSTQADRIKIYVNGERITSWSLTTLISAITLNQDFAWINQGGVVQAFGGLSGSGHGIEGANLQLAEIVFNDGQAYGPDSYGETKNGVWIPKDPSGLTFGNNGYHLKLAAGAIGTDSSGNGNNFTVNNIPAHDVMLDSPTFNSDSNGGNFATLNPLSQQAGSTENKASSLSEGNLFQALVAAGSGATATMGFNSTSGGKWYWEVGITNFKAGCIIGITNDLFNTDAELGYNSPGSPSGADQCGLYIDNGNISQAGTGDGSNFTSYGSQLSAGDVVGVALDVDNGKIWFSVNGTFINSGNPAGGSNAGRGASGTITTAFNFSRDWFPIAGNWSASTGTGITWNFGQEGTFGGTETAGGNSDASGYGNFFSAPPTGFLAICTGNLPAADAIDPAQTSDDFPQKLFSPLLYVGNGSDDRNITGVGFAPDWVWMKSRTDSEGYQNWDTSRGVEKRIQQNSSGAEESTSDKFQAFQSDGFQVGSSNDTNKSSSNFVTWNWRANGGTTASGSGNLTSTQQVDPSGGFSIVKAVGDGGSGDKTISHGLSAAPTCIIAKNLDAAYNWDTFWSEGLTATSYSLRLNTTDAQLSGRWSTVNSSIFTCKENYTWAGTNNFIYYCFTNIEGYIKSGSYVANGTADNAFVYLGFRPAFLLVKGVVSGAAWTLIDNKRDGFNPTPSSLEPNSAAGTYTTAAPFADLLSNGFKVRTANAVMGSTSYDPYVYLAIAENPFKYALAR